jgi:ADP-heptose:LPS heptosyltransferase
MGDARTSVLILQIGSLGDTVISLPCYREIARRHPQANRYLITNFPIGSKMVPAEAILRPTEVIQSSIEYPIPLRAVNKMLDLRRRIMALRPAILYYLLPEVKTSNLLRHYAFFKLCGIPTIRGMPWSHDFRFPREVVSQVQWESEASRLLRTIGVVSGPPSDADRDLMLSPTEQAKATSVLQALNGVKFVAISVGGKVPLNNWGDENWTQVLSALGGSISLAVVFVGSADERERNQKLMAHWNGPSMNTCGDLTPRETAAVLARAAAFVGHDTGTLHLAAAVNTPVIGIFSARNRPGKWFSDRARDTFFYNRVGCAGCELLHVKECQHNMICMIHDPTAVISAVQRMILRA